MAIKFNYHSLEPLLESKWYKEIEEVKYAGKTLSEIQKEVMKNVPLYLDYPISLIDAGKVYKNYNTTANSNIESEKKISAKDIQRMHKKLLAKELPMTVQHLEECMEKPLPPYIYEEEVESPQLAVPTASFMKKEKKHEMPYTQKGYGVMRLRNILYMGCIGVPSETSIIPDPYNTYQELKFPLFARPCPTRPRHGFVESRVIHSFMEALQLYGEAVRQDEEGRAELILMPKCTGKNSAVALYNNVTWGEQNDGVTGGSKGATYTIPTPGDKTKWNKEFIRVTGAHREGFIQDTAYVEIVEDKGISRLVQLRDGPQPPEAGLKDIIPEDVPVITRIIKYDHDLLRWEQTIKEAASSPEGVVVYLPDYPLSSHHVVHALQYGLPVVTDKKTYVEVGNSLTKSDFKLPKLKENAYLTIHRHMKRELIRSTLVNGNGHYEDEEYFGANYGAALTAIAAVHSQSLWGPEQHLLKLRGITAIYLMRFALAACMGELRHMQVKGLTPLDDKMYNTSSRTSIYDHYLLYGSIEDALNLFPTIIEDFNCGGWEEEDDENYCGDRHCEDCFHGSRTRTNVAWRNGFGGAAWGRVAKAAYTMVIAINEFLTTPNEDNWRSVVVGANNFIHQSHNGGKVLNKWTGHGDMDKLAIIPAIGFMNQTTANIIFSR